MVTYSKYYSIQFSLNVIANLLTFIMIIEVDKCVHSQMLHEDQFCGIGKNSALDTHCLLFSPFVVRLPDPFGFHFFVSPFLFYVFSQSYYYSKDLMNVN